MPESPAPVERAEVDRVLDELQQVYRTLYALTEDEERGRILGTLLAHEMPQMRSFGLDLARRTLLNAREVPASVLERGEALLFDVSSPVRKNAAQLVATRGGDVSTRLLSKALREERDEVVVTEILRALTQRPGVVRIESLEPWLGKGGQVAESAFAVAEAIARQRPEGIAPAYIEMLRGALGEFSTETGTPARISLAWAIGSEAYVRSALWAGDQTQQLAAARSLAEDAGSADLVIEAARENPRLFPVAVDAIARHRSDASGYRAIAALDAGTDEVKREGLRRVLLALGPEALTDVAMEKSDLFQREQMLRHVEAIAQDPSGDAVSWDAALVELIETRSKLWDCSGAMRVAALLDDEARAVYADRLTTPTLRCAVMLGRLEEAEAQTRALVSEGGKSGETVAAVWLESIGRIRAAGVNTQEATKRIRSLLWDSMNELQRERLKLYEQDRVEPPATTESGDPGEATLTPL